jgi:hypothetical protein
MRWVIHRRGRGVLHTPRINRRGSAARPPRPPGAIGRAAGLAAPGAAPVLPQALVVAGGLQAARGTSVSGRAAARGCTSRSLCRRVQPGRAGSASAGDRPRIDRVCARHALSPALGSGTLRRRGSLLVPRLHGLASMAPGLRVRAMKIPRDVRPLAQRARTQGWHVCACSGGHIRWSSPAGGFVISSATPSDRRAPRNLRRALRRHGLVLA